MSKLRMFMFTLLGVLFASATAFAQGAGAADVGEDNANTVLKWSKLAAGIGFALAAGLGALGEARVVTLAAEDAVRNAGGSERNRILMIIVLAFIEPPVICSL